MRYWTAKVIYNNGKHFCKPTFLAIEAGSAAVAVRKAVQEYYRDYLSLSDKRLLKEITITLAKSSRSPEAS